MTIDSRTTRSGPWTPRVAVQLAVLAAAAFIYITAETVPVGALPAIARDLGVSEALVGTLLAWYALIAALTTIPLVHATAYWSRRRVLLLALICLTVSQLVSALAPTFVVLNGARVLCAVTHGLLFSVLAPIAARLVPASHAGRATTVTYLGAGLTLVLGTPLTAAMSLVWGWRSAVAVVAVAAVVVTVAAGLVLPAMPADPRAVGRRPHHRNNRLLILCALTLIVVAGHYISYTFIVVVIRDAVGVAEPNLVWLLEVFGVAGLLAMPLVGRPLDRHPRAALCGCLAAMAAAFGLLAALATGAHHTAATVLAGTAAIMVWGAMTIAVSPMLQFATMRAAPGDPDGASGMYVATCQVGIMAGSLLGGLLDERAEVSVMLAASALLVGAAALATSAGRGLFEVS